MSSEKVINIGICGLGTVGGGTLKLLRDNSAEISKRLGATLRVSHVATRSPKQKLTNGIASVGSDVFVVANDPEIDILVETIGGNDPALELVRTALENGKHVVTANKALLAEHGNELFELAASKKHILAFESSVAGGIPVIKALREGLAANEIEWLAGILNGTCNFILSKMARDGSQFEAVLKEAKEEGYAEADPTFDVDGIDAAHKLTILASIAFGTPLQFDKIEAQTEGIRQLTPEDFRYAEDLGYRIKHLGIARRGERGIELRLHPTLIPKTNLLASVDGVDNAVLIHGNKVDSTLYRGPGAGGDATASAVVADLIDIARQHIAGAPSPVYPALGYLQQTAQSLVNLEDIESEYYLRIPVANPADARAKITSVLQAEGISIKAETQKDNSTQVADNSANQPVVILTDKVVEKTMNQATEKLKELDVVTGDIMRLRVEP